MMYSEGLLQMVHALHRCLKRALMRVIIQLIIREEGDTFRNSCTRWQSAS
jgi:hypothetical protein